MPLTSTLVFPQLPEGWFSTLDEFVEWLSENNILTVSGGVIEGQIGGDEPITNIGPWFSGITLFLWDTTREEYREANSPPVASYLLMAGTTTPENYLICEGQQILKEDYPYLYAAIGDTYNRSGDADATKFRVPDWRGRSPAGVGMGEYDTDDTSGYVGKFRDRVLGDAWGFEWPQRRLAKHPNIPVGHGVDEFYRVILPGYAPGGNILTSSYHPCIGIRVFIRYK